MNQALRLAVAGLGLLGTTGLLSLAPRAALAEPNASEAAPAFSPYTLSGVPASEQASEALETAGPGARLRMYVPVQGDFNPDGTVAHALSNVIYVNDCRAGHNCTFRPGNDNSSTNTSGIPDFVGTLSAYKFGATQWAQTEACLREVFAPFGLQITTTDPGTTPHMELVVAGDPNQIMTNADGILGIAPFPAGSCSIIQQPIAFAFANAHDFYPSSSRPDEICATAAQEIAHTWALDHSVLANDPMTYKANNGNRRHFQDQEARCGSDGPVGGGTPSCTGSGLNCVRNCTCGGEDGDHVTQNSVADIKDLFGDGTPTPPTVMITAPTAGESVAPGFPVRATITDDQAVARAELRVDGVLVGTTDVAPYVFNAPTTLGEGNHHVEVRGFDIIGAATNAVVDVVIGTPCEIPGDCAGMQTCIAGRCVAGPGTPGGLGEDCLQGTECNSGLCGDNGAGEHHCIEICDQNNDPCPSGFGCIPFGDQGACWPGADGGGGGCSTSDDSTAALGLSLVFAGLVLGRSRGDRRERTQRA